MATVNTVVLYFDIINKVLVSVSGSPTSLGTMYAGDKPLFVIYPVQPNVTSGSTVWNPNNGYISVNMAGYTMNLTMAGTPNAAAPPTSFASLDGLTWSATLSAFTGLLDLTPAAVTNYIGSNSSALAYYTIDVFDASNNRTTFTQSTFTIAASNDTPGTGPAGPSVQYLTLAQALNLFVLVAGAPGNNLTLISPDGTQKRVLSCGNDGSLQGL